VSLDSLYYFEEGDEKPDEWEFRNWADVLRQEFSGLRQEQGAEVDVYFQKFNVYTPQNPLGPNPVEPVRSGSAPADANAAIDSLVPPKIIVKVKPAYRKKKYRDQATKLALFGNALLNAWREKSDVLKLTAANMVIRRVGVARVVYDPALFPPYAAPDRHDDESDADYEDRLASDRERFRIKKRKRVPIVFEVRDPTTVAWRTNNRGEFLVVAEQYETTALEALQTFRGFPAAKKYLQQFRENPDQRVTMKDVWYGKWRCMYLDDVSIFQGDGPNLSKDGVLPHGYPIIPYLVAAFRELPFEEPHNKYRGMLTEALGLYPAESNVLTMNVAILGWNAWRTWKGWTHDQKPIFVVPGTYIPLDQRKGEYLEMLEGTAVPPEVMDTASIFDQYIQRNGVAQGPRTAEGTRSGQQLWAIQAMRAMKIENAKAGLAALTSMALGLAAMILEENVKEELTLPTDAKDKESGEDLGVVTIGPSDIDGYYEGFRASFVQRLDPATIEQAKGLAALWGQKFMPWEEAVEESGMTDNPADWEAKIYREIAERSPIMADLMTLEHIRAYYDPDFDENDVVEFGKQLVERLQQKMMAEGNLQGGKGGTSGQPPNMGSPPSPKGPVSTGAELAQLLSARRQPSGGRGQPSRGGGGRQGSSYGG
jgi:hypothetical protein